MARNEVASYSVVDGLALLTGWLAPRYAHLPKPFVFALAGLLPSIFAVHKIREHTHHEA